MTIALACGWQTGLKAIQLARWQWARHAGPLLLAVMLLGHWAELQIGYGQIVPHDLANSIVDEPYFWTGMARVVHSAQSAVPANAKILAYTDAPFLFDFVSNPIFVADWPGESSPPPGLPVHQGGEAVASYLLGQNIHYVIYSYTTKARFPRAYFQFNLDPKFGRVMNRQAGLAFDFQDDLDELAKTRLHLYDDGYLYVLDLASRQASKASPQ
jgi:hypothetical protein